MSPRAELGLALVLVAVVAVGVVAGRRQTPSGASSDERPSTFLAGPRGSEAVHAVLVRLGRSVERRRTPLFDLARDSGHRPDTVVIAAPVVPLHPGEVSAVVRFVTTGGAVVAAEGGGGVTACAGWVAVRASGGAVAATAGGHRLPAVARTLRERRDAGHDPEPSDRGCGALRSAATDTVVRAESGSPVVVVLRYPQGGRVTLLADADYLRNREWRDSDVGYLLAPLLAPPGARVSWDEYHQGFGAAPSLAGVVLGWLARAPAGWALLHLAGVALLAVGVAAVRFGPARRAVEPSRRSALEHVEALASGLHRAGGAATSIELILAGLRRRLHLTPGRPGGDPHEWLGAIELALAGSGSGAVRRLRAARDGPDDGAAVLAAAHAVEDVWEELRPGRTRA
jgi:hypothetical protein